ncbi:MAG: magnesium transporter [Abitibacteriaceae bacterium]|nr:magnesium transporter [Abditibacteriaceae bacterium]
MSESTHSNTRFAKRRKLLTVREDAMQVAQGIKEKLDPQHVDELRALLDEQHPADLADAMLFLSPGEERIVFNLLDNIEAAEVLDEVDAQTEANLVGATSPDKLADILAELPPDEGADVVGALPQAEAERVLDLTAEQIAGQIRTLLAYPADTAGGIMSLGFVEVPESATQAQALQRFREKQDAEHIFYVYVVDAQRSLKGIIDLLHLLRAAPDTPVRDLMTEDIISVHPDCDQEQVASVFARYDLTALPVVSDEPSHKLLGVITADDIIDVMQEEHAEDVAHMAGSDAQELEHKSPAQVAKLRMPWIMATMFIELLAGLVIHFFDATMTKFILLASFMPIISAISGNTGLQSAAIIIRGLSTGHVQMAHWKHAVVRQLETTLILGGACAAVLGTIGAIWDKHWVFGLVVFLGMFASVNIAGVVGTIVPLISKRAGFDPALTAGPFETAFQDVVGISIFLSLAATLLNWLR